MQNFSYLDIGEYLVKKGVNPFEPVEGKTLFIEYLTQLRLRKIELKLPSVQRFLKAVLDMPEEYYNNVAYDSLLNDIMKAIPYNWFLGDSKYRSLAYLLIAQICCQLIEKSLYVRHHLDDQGRTPLHNLLTSLFDNCEFTPLLDFETWSDETESLRFLIQLLASNERIVNTKDENQVTPYTWILLWQESVKDYMNYHDTSERQRLITTIEELDKHFCLKGANKEEADVGMDFIR